MTSTNDGKEVKSNQTSSPKGKTYFIELYQSLDSRLNEAVSASDRTASLCEAWKKVHSLCLHSTTSTHLHLLNWLQRHTAKTVLQTGWQESKHRDDRANLAEAINVFIVECRTSVDTRNGPSPPWEGQLIARGEWFKAVQESPWEHPVLLGLLNRGETPPTDDDVLEWLSLERGVTFLVRIQTLMTNKANDLAMKLATAVMERIRSDRPSVGSGEVKEELKESPTFGERLREEAGFTEDLMAMLTDLEFVLLHKLDSSRCIDVAKQTPFQGLYKFLERLQSRSETSPREKKLWKNSKEVAVLIARVVMARCMMVPVCSGEVRFALYACARFVARLVARPRLPAATAALAAPALTAAHLHTLAMAVDKQLEEENEISMKPFVCELYVRAITSGMNELERLKLETEKDKEARSMEQTLASWFVQLGAVLASSDRLKAECELTAFSVHPSPVMYSRIKAAPDLPPIQMDSLETTTPVTNTEFGSWASDSRSQTNFVKTSETLNMKKQSQANVLSTAIVNEGEALGLSPELCQDITTLLSGPRVKTLSWDMNREVLLENCRTYLDRTHGGTKAVTTELKYLNLNPADFQDLPEEDENESDLYYGIEKGYEHLVEFQPEEFVASYDYDETETAYSSEEYEEKPLRKKKSKKPVPAEKPQSDEDDPLSNVAETKRKEKKERPNSKERSKKKDVDPLDIESKDKKDKPRKERKKKEKIPKPEGTLASLVGLKIAKTKHKVSKIIHSISNDADSQGKASTNSNVVFDGLYSMDDMKSPDNQSLNLDGTRFQNIELSGNMSRTQIFSQPPSVSAIKIASPSSYKSLSPSDHSRNTSPTPASDAVMSSLTKLLEARQRKIPNAILRPECSMKIESNFSPKGVDIPELPVSYIDKQQISNTAIKSPVIQYAGKSPNKPSQSYYNYANQYLQDIMIRNRGLSTPPPADKFLESVNLVSIYDKGPSSLPNRSCNNSNVPQDKSKPGVNHHGFNEFGTPNTYYQYPVSKQSKKVIRPASSVDLISNLKSQHKTQNVKQMPQKKPDGNLNTFSRLSYFKNKQTDRSKSQDLPQTVGQRLDDFIWDNIKKQTNPRDRPMMASMLGAPAISPPRPTLSEKDQNDLIHLLRQQDALNRHNLPLPQSNLGFPIPSTPKISSNAIPSNHTFLPSNQMRKPHHSHKTKINIISTSIIKPTNVPKPANSKNPTSEGKSKKPKSKVPMPEWKNVMDAISKHKTPSRGPNALDMALKNSSFEKAFEESLEKGSILFTENKKPLQDMSSTGPHQQEFANFAKSMPNYLVDDTVRIVKNKNHSLTNLKQQTIKANRNPKKKSVSLLTNQKYAASTSAEVIPQTENTFLVQNTKATQEPKKYPKIKKPADFPRQKTAEQVNVDRKIENLIKNNHIEIISKNKSNVTNTHETTAKLKKVLHNSSVAMQKQKQSSVILKIPKQTAVDLKKEIKPITDHRMPQNIKKYLYTEPKQDESIPGMQNSEYDQLDELIDDDLRKEMDELSSDEEDYISAAQNLLKNTRTNEKRVNVVYNQPANDVVYSHPLNNVAKVSQEIGPLSKRNDIPQIMTPDSQQRLNNKGLIREVQNKPKSLNATNVQSLTTQSPPVVQVLNYNNNNSHATLAEPNVYITSPRSLTVQNAIIIPPNMVYNGYATIQTPVPPPSMTQNIYMASNNAPNVNVFQATQYAVPILSPAIIASAVAVPVVDVPSVIAIPPTPDTTVTPSQYSYVNSAHKHTTDQGNTRKVDVTDSVQCVANEIPRQKESMSDDINISKSGDRKVLKEVQDKHAGETIDGKRWSQKVSEKSEKHKTQADLERVINKRMLILNRQIIHYCGFQTIPLGYSPLRFPKLEKKNLDVAELKSTSDDPLNQNNELNSEVKSPATPDSYKENKDEAMQIRRILLRSSNKLKSKLFPSPKPGKEPKESPNVSSETQNENVSRIGLSDTEIKNEQRRASKRIRNKIVAPKDTTSKNEQRRKPKTKPKANISEIKATDKAKPKEILVSETDEFFDVEAELLGSTIPKIIPVNLLSPDPQSTFKSTVEVCTEILSADNESFPIQNESSKDLAVDTAVIIEEAVFKPLILPEAANKFTVVSINTPLVKPTTETEYKITPHSDFSKINQPEQISDITDDFTFKVNHGLSKEKELEVSGRESYVCVKALDNKTIFEVNSAVVKSIQSCSISETPSKSITEVFGKEIDESIMVYGNDVTSKENESPIKSIQADPYTETSSKINTLASKLNEPEIKCIVSDTITSTPLKTCTPYIENKLKAEATEAEKDENTKAGNQSKSQGVECTPGEVETLPKPGTLALNKNELGAEVIERDKYINTKVLRNQSITETEEPVIKSLESDTVLETSSETSAPNNDKEDPKLDVNVSENAMKDCAKIEQSVDKNDSLQITYIEKNVNHSHIADSHQGQPSNISMGNDDDADIQFIDEIPPVKPSLQNKPINDNILIESITNADCGDPLKKTVRIIANGKKYIGTVKGSVDIDSLFDNPEILTLLLKQLKLPKKLYSIKLNVGTSNSSKIVSSNIEEKPLRQYKKGNIKTVTPLETVSLLSDDEDETSQELETEFGKYKINSVDRDILTKHQNKFKLKSYVFVKKLSLDEEDAVKRRTECRTTKLNLRNNKVSLQRKCNSRTINIVHQSGRLSQEKSSEPKVLPAIPDLVQGIFSDFENILAPANKPAVEPVILIDDSSNDSAELSEPVVKIDALKEMLLKDLGVIGSSFDNDDVQATEAIEDHLTNDNVIKRTESEKQLSRKMTMADAINRKCFVKLIRCDHKVGQLKRAKTDLSESIENLNIERKTLRKEDIAEEDKQFKEIGDIVFASLSRSSSLSILDVIEDISVVNERITETYLDTSSPVMEVYELIALMEGKLLSYPNISKVDVRLKCDSEWRTTKEVEHLLHKNLIEENVPSLVPKLATLILSYIQKEDLVSRYDHVIYINSSSNSLKRKSEVCGAPVAKVSKIEQLPQITVDLSATNVLDVDSSAHVDKRPNFELEDITPDLSDIDDSNTDEKLINNNTECLENQETSHIFESKPLKSNCYDTCKNNATTETTDKFINALVTPIDFYEDNLNEKEHAFFKDLIGEISSIIPTNISENILFGCASTCTDTKEVENTPQTNLNKTFSDQVETEDLKYDMKLTKTKEGVNNFTNPSKPSSIQANELFFGQYENMGKMKELGNYVDVEKNKENIVERLEDSLQELPSPKLNLNVNDTGTLFEHITETTKVNRSVNSKLDENVCDKNTDQIDQEMDQTKAAIAALVCDKNNVETTIDIQTDVQRIDLSEESTVDKLSNETINKECSSDHHKDTGTLLENVVKEPIKFKFIETKIEEDVYEKADNTIQKMDQIEGCSDNDESNFDLTNDIQMNVKRVDSSDYAIVEMVVESTTTTVDNNILEIIAPSNEDIVKAYIETKLYEASSIAPMKDDIAEPYLEPNFNDSVYDRCVEKRQILDQIEVPVCFLPCTKIGPETTIRANETDLYVILPDNIIDNQSLKYSDSKKNETCDILSKVKDRESVNDEVTKDLKTEIVPVFVENPAHELNLLENITIRHQQVMINSHDKPQTTDDILSAMNKKFRESENISKVKDRESVNDEVTKDLKTKIAPVFVKNPAHELNLLENITIRHQQDMIYSPDKPQTTDDILSAMNKMFGESENMDSICTICKHDNSDKLLSPHNTNEMDNNLQKILEGTESVNVGKVQQNDQSISPNELTTGRDDNIDGINVSLQERLSMLEDSLRGSVVSKTCDNDNSDKLLSILSVDSPESIEEFANNLQRIPKGTKPESVQEVQVSIQENDHYMLPKEFATARDGDEASNHDGDEPSNHYDECNIDGINLSLREGLSVLEDCFSGSVVEEVVDMLSDEIIDDVASCTSDNIDTNTAESTKIEILTDKVPEVVTCYALTIVDEVSQEGNVNIDDDFNVNIKLILPKHTYANNKSSLLGQSRPLRSLKRKKDMSEVKTTEKKYRKGKNIDYPKITAAAIAELAYAKEYKRIMDYCSTIKFSYALPFHVDHIDVTSILKAWPIQKQLAVEDKEPTDQDRGILYTDTDDNENSMPVTDPLNQTLNEEILNGDNVNNYKSIEINENNFNMGFGERSGRVIQKIGTGITQLSAATLSDVKQYQPFLKFDVSKVKENIAYATQKDNLSQFARFMNIKQKVKSFFKKTEVELVRESLQDKELSANDREFTDFPFGLTSTEFIEVPRTELFVNVVQVGQLAVSAAAQNPVTCDPRVTHVADASPSQCSDNSPGDSQATIETEYTELTTANITLPMQEYSQQQQSPKSQEQNSPVRYDDANSSQTLSIVKIELMEETSQENDVYENVFSPLPTNNVDYSFEDTANNMFNSNKTTNNNSNMYNTTEIVSDNTFTNIFNSPANMGNSYTNLDNTPSSMDNTYTNMENGNKSTSIYSASSDMGNSSNEIENSAHIDVSPNLNNSFKHNVNGDNPSTNINNTYTSLYRSMGSHSNASTYNDVSCNSGSNANNSPIHLENRPTNINTSPQMDNTNAENAYDYSYENVDNYAENLENNNYSGNVDNFTANDFGTNVDNYPSNVDNYATNNESYPNNIHSFATSVENYSSNADKNTSNISSHINQDNLDNSTTNMIEESQPQDLSMGNLTQESKESNFETQENETSKPDQLANAMSAAGISSESVITSGADELVKLTNQTAQSTANNIPKSTPINVMTLQQALAQALPPPHNQTGTFENTLPNNPVAQPVLHIVQGPNNAQTVINKANGTHLVHIVQNKNNPAGNGLSLVDAGLQQGGNQLIHIVNNGSQNNSQFLKRVNLLTNLTNAQGSNEQKMIQFVCKSADGKSIQLNAGHQRSMVLRLHPTSVQTPIKPTEPQDLSASPSTASTTNNQDPCQDIKSTSVYEETYSQFIQNPSPVAETSTVTSPEKSTSLPKFNQVFGKQSYQENQNEMNNGLQENSQAPQEQNSGSLEQSAETNNPPLLVPNAQSETTQAQSNSAQQIKQTISPVNIHTTMHGGVIYTRQIPVNISGGQTINLITVPSTELVDTAQKQQTDGTFANQEREPTSIIKLLPHQVPNNGNPSPEENSAQPGTSSEPNSSPQPPQQPVLTQMRIKLPMLSKGPHIVPGARLVRPSFFQIQRNVIPGTNPPVYQQLVLTTAPSLGQTIRLPTQNQSQLASSSQTQPLLVQTPQHTPTPHIPVQQVQHAPSTLMHSAPQTPISQSAPARNKNSEPESELSTLTLEQLREFDMVLEQVKERSVQPSPSSTPVTKPAPADSTDGPTLSTTSVSESTQQVIYSVENNQPANVVSYVNRKSTITSATTSFVRSPDSSGIVDTPSSSTVQITHTVTKSTTSEAGSSAVTQPKKKKKKKPLPSSNALASLVAPPPKTNSLKPQEDEQTTQRILYILAEYKEQVENSPDKHKPAPRRRNQFPPTTGSKRKRSHCGSRSLCRHECIDMSPVHGENGDDSITLGSEDSSCGTTFSECTDCQESHSPEDSPTKIVRRLTFEQETTTQITQTRTVPQQNVIVGDGQTITVARTTTATAAAAKPTTTVLMPANYLLPVSMIKGGQQIAIMTNRGPKILVGAGESNAGALLFQRLIGPGLKPVLARPGVRHIRLPATTLHNLQTFNIQTTPVTAAHPPDGSAPQVPTPAPPELVDTRAMTSPWQDRGAQHKPDRGPSPDCTEPWNMPSSSIADDYGYEEIVRTDNMERTVLDAIPDRYSPDMEAQRIFDKMFDDSKKSMYDSPRCGYDIDTSDVDDKPYHQVVQQRKDGRHHRVTHVSTAALRHKYAILEHELRLQKSLSEECEDLGVDSPSASDLFPEADILFGAPSPAHEQTIDQCNTPPPIPMHQSIPQPDLDDQIATDRLLNPDTRHDDLDLNLDDVGEMVTVGEDGVATIPTINAEEFARSHPNTTFHTEPEDGEIPPFTIAQTLKGPHITFHANRIPGTVVMAPQTTVISQATVSSNVGNNTVKFTDIDNMINAMPCPQVPVLVKESPKPAPRLAKFETKDPGTSSAAPPRPLSKFDSLLAETKQQLYSARQVVHSTGHGTHVIRRLRHDDKTNTRTHPKFHSEEPRSRLSISDEVKLRNDRAMVESMGDNASSPGQPELFWDSTSTDRHERRFHFSDSEKVTKSPFDELLNDSSAYGPHTRLDSVIKAARPERVFQRTSFEGISVSGAVDETRPLRTYPPKRAHAQHSLDTDRHSTHKASSHHHEERKSHHEDKKSHHHDGNKKRVEPPRCQEGEGRRRTGRGVVKRNCSCCNGPNAPPKKRSRPKKHSSSAPDFTPTT